MSIAGKNIAKKIAAAIGGVIILAGVLTTSPATAAAPPQVSKAAVSAIKVVPAKAGSGHVSIPSGYVYNPKTKNSPSLHDYCTKSPDSWGAADFRGPCARHDMCIQYKQAVRVVCDARFYANLVQESKHAYGFLDPRRAVVLQIAKVYYAAVTAATFIGR